MNALAPTFPSSRPAASGSYMRSSRGVLTVSFALVALGVASWGRAHDAPAEYFVGDDPGMGLATPLSLTSIASGQLEIGTLTLPGSAAGSAQMGLRARNAAGSWGHTQFRRVFWLKPAATAQLSYQWQGKGGAQEIALPLGGCGPVTLSLPAATFGEALRLRVNARADGLVGIGSARGLWVRGDGATGRLHYALDQAPAPATSPFVPLPSLAAGGSFAAPALDLGAPTPGFHTLHLLATDAAGATVRTRRFLHVMPETVATLRGLGYAWKTAEYGPLLSGHFEVMPLTAGTGVQSVLLPKPASITQLDYTLVLGLMDGSGDLGFGQASTVRLGTEYDAWAGIHLDGYPPSEATELADPDEDGVVNLLEYAFGLLPGNKESAPPYTVESVAFSGYEGEQFCELRFGYRQRRGGIGSTGVDYVAGGIRYRVELSTDLVNWTPYSLLSGAIPYLYVNDQGDGFEQVQLTCHVWDVLADPAKRRVFGRIVIEIAE